MTEQAEAYTEVTVESLPLKLPEHLTSLALSMSELKKRHELERQACNSAFWDAVHAEYPALVHKGLSCNTEFVKQGVAMLEAEEDNKLDKLKTLLNRTFR